MGIFKFLTSNKSKLSLALPPRDLEICNCIFLVLNKMLKYSFESSFLGDIIATA